MNTQVDTRFLTFPDRTSREIRAAILKTADLIREEPTAYNFLAHKAPNEGPGHGQGCMLSWAAHFLGSLVREGVAVPYTDFMRADLRADERFYNEIERLCAAIEPEEGEHIPTALRLAPPDAAILAQALEQYVHDWAEVEYHEEGEGGA